MTGRTSTCKSEVSETSKRETRERSEHISLASSTGTHSLNLCSLVQPVLTRSTCTRSLNRYSLAELVLTRVHIRLKRLGPSLACLISSRLPCSPPFAHTFTRARFLPLQLILAHARFTRRYAGDGNGGRGSFNTTAIRDTCPRIHSGAVPFETNESKFSTRRIGPGSYEAGRSSFKIKVQKSLREEPVGFSSTNQRPCMKGVKAGAGVQHVIGEEMEEEERNVAPGPDQYNPDYYTMSFKAAKVAQASRKVGVFGTTGARFRPKNELEEKAEVTLEHVGPGSYDVVPQGGIPRPRFPTSSFRGAGRFDTQADFVKTKNGGFLVCGSNDTLVKSPSVVEISGEARPVNTGNYFMSSDDDTIAAHKKTARPGFGASAKRGGEGVNIDGRKISENPGPEYKIDMFNIKRPDRILVHGGGERKEILGGRSTFGKDGRKFDTGNFGPEALGPGSYELPGSINSHSFNITMKAKKTAYRKSRSGGGVGEGGSSSSARQKEEEGGGSGERLEVASLAL